MAPSASIEEYNDLETDYYQDNIIDAGPQNLNIFQGYVDDKWRYEKFNRNTELQFNHEIFHPSLENINTPSFKQLQKEESIDVFLDMGVLENRLSTYKHLPAGAMPYSQLAKNGFFYSNNMLTCSSCKYTVDPRKYDNVVKLHNIESPLCDYSTNTPNDNFEDTWSLPVYESRKELEEQSANPRNTNSEGTLVTGITFQSAKLPSACEMSGPQGIRKDRSRGTSRHLLPSNSGNVTIANSKEPTDVTHFTQSARNFGDLPTSTFPVNVNRTSSTKPMLRESAKFNERAANAQYPEFCEIKDRLESFDAWPHARPDKLSVAKAGFIYRGTGDYVKCFYCGLAIYSWEPNDDPFFEHAKFTIKCNWLEDITGKEFIEKCKQKHKLSNQGMTECGIRNEDVLPAERKLETKIEEKIEIPEPKTKAQVTNDDEIVRSKIKLAFEYGFEGDVIMAVIKQHLEENKGVFSMSNDEMINRIQRYGQGDEQEKGNEQENEKAIDDAENAILWELSNLQLGGSKTPFSTPNESSKSNSDVLKKLEELEEKQSCKICLDNSVDTLLTPCNHLVACSACAKEISSCPICRAKIRDRVKIYQS